MHPSRGVVVRALEPGSRICARCRLHRAGSDWHADISTMPTTAAAPNQGAAPLRLGRSPPVYSSSFRWTVHLAVRLAWVLSAACLLHVTPVEMLTAEGLKENAAHLN
jgi:hypothetical protein